MKKARRVFLGNSLTSNSLAREDDLIVDFWEGGSDLYGWNLGSKCFDRIPTFLRSNCCPQLFRGALKEVDVEVVVEGPESNVNEKLGDVSKSVIGYSGRLLVPELPACFYYRELLRKVGVTRIFSPISKVDLQSKTVRTYHCEVEYEELVNTLPLEYFLYKSGLGERGKKLAYTSAYVFTLMSNTRLREYTKVFVGHRGYSLGYVVSYSQPPVGKLIYAFVPTSKETFRAELASKAVAELKRLKIIDGSIRLARSFFVKYFRLGGDVGGVSEALRSYGVVLAGRYGSWSETSLCDICR